MKIRFVAFLLILGIKLAVVSYRLNIGVAVEYQDKQSIEYGISLTDDVLSILNHLERLGVDVDVLICLFSAKYDEPSLMVIDSTNLILPNYPVIFSTIKHAHLCPLSAFYEQIDMNIYQGFLFLSNNLYRRKYNNKLVKQVIGLNNVLQESMMYIYFTPELLSQYKAANPLFKANIYSVIYSLDETRNFVIKSLLNLAVSIDDDDIMDIDIVTDTIEYHPLPINQSSIISNDEQNDPYITSGSCNLWWPLNNTILYVHTLPVTDIFDKIEKIIFFCDPNIHSSNSNEKLVYFANFSEIGFDKKHNQLFRKSEETVIDGSKIQNKKPISLPVMLALASDVSDRNIVDYISLDVSICYRSSIGYTHCIGNFRNIKMDIVEGTKSQGNYVYVHPMMNQIENRDELGLALSFLLRPNASTFIEIGVQDGKYSENILLTWNELSRMILIDPWQAQNCEDYVDVANKNNANHMNSMNKTASKMSEYAAHVTILRMTSLEASVLFLNNSIDIVYIDALHHFTAVMQDIKSWWHKIKPGGMIAGHDYLLDVSHDTIFTVKPAVDQFALHNNLTVFQTKDYEYPSWMIYKPTGIHL